jgi:predicted molibdopterin-dependent oxidoreductase YjgC/glycine cleavage system H lipoate-binding protein
VAGLAATFGSGAMTNSFAELENADCILVIGSNTTVAHPIAAKRLLRAKDNGGRLMVADPRQTQIAQLAHLHVQHRLGTDVALINGLMHIIYRNGWHNQAFIDSRTENFPALLEVIEQFPPERVSQITGVPVAELTRMAEWYAKSEASAIVYVLGITQHSTGTDNVKSLANLAMLCGHVGRPSTGVNPIRGQNNVQGACDMGALPNVLPGYQYVNVPANVEKFEKAWNVKLSAAPGLTMVEQIEAIGAGKFKGLVVFGANPVLSYPDANRVRDALGSLEFFLVLDIFPTATTAMAHVVLPAASFAESDGTFSNSERRVQRVRQAIEPLAGKANWEAIQELSTRLGYPMSYPAAEAIFKEMAGLTPSYGGMSYPRLSARGLCWPCPTPDHPGTPYLHKDKFVRGLGCFQAIDYRPPAEAPDADYPFWLTTGTISSQYLTGTMTRRCPSLHRENPEAFIEINPRDARRLGIQAGEQLKAGSRRGTITAKAVLTERVRPGVAFIPMHFLEDSVNRLANAALDPVTKTPEYKVCAVKLTRLAEPLEEVFGFKVPLSSFLHQGHTWAALEQGGRVRLGLDDFSQKVLGRADKFRLPEIGAKIHRDLPAMTFFRGENEAAVLAPLDGVIEAVNPKVLERPGLVHDDPYGLGWLMVVSPTNLQPDLEKLHFEKGNVTWIENETHRLMGLLESSLGVTLPSGGTIVDDVYGHYPQLEWPRLVKEFLRSA